MDNRASAALRIEAENEHFSLDSQKIMAENKEEKVEAEDKPIVEEANDVPQDSEEVVSVQESKQSTAQNDTIEQIDIGVIGGGIAGVYAAYRLKQQHPGKKIYIYELQGSLVAINILHRIMPTIWLG